MRVETLISYRAGRAVSWLAGLLGPAVFSLGSKTWVCGCAAPLSIPQPAALRACRTPKVGLGLAMRRGGPKGQTKGETKWSLQGRADLRAPKRSACRRQEAPKKYIYR
ncbi:hypothetical protein SGRA_1686 [Saprospira grandis str. Lewin]|uniref:Uncharacterized protein n=1 Tax=Saprospira grandis (strain Lewin) TaxID=984262 RepID=H6LAD6_SAPGL|nr:hypothetical protein SGRA_1686 [Saprospira grandis str. Lewin]